jgi:hypothetical protein
MTKQEAIQLGALPPVRVIKRDDTMPLPFPADDEQMFPFMAGVSVVVPKKQKRSDFVRPAQPARYLNHPQPKFRKVRKW